MINRVCYHIVCGVLVLTAAVQTKAMSQTIKAAYFF